MSNGNGNGAPEQEMIVEPMIVIGRTETGKTCIGFPTGMNPAAAVILIEQMRIQLVGSYNFDRQSMVTPARGIPNLRGN